MVIPIFPHPTDSENRFFHPVLIHAINEVLQQRGVNREFHVQNQFETGTGPVDIVIIRTLTGRVILPIEMKRQKSAVRGIGRRQARDYWHNLGNQCETPFYCVSNLEFTELFRYDVNRPTTVSQSLILQHEDSGELDVTPDDIFLANLTACIEEVLDIVLGIEPHHYRSGVTQFQNIIRRYTNDLDNWHKPFVPFLFEYIRGTSNLKFRTNSWNNANFYRRRPSQLIRLGEQLDFFHIFKEPVPSSKDDLAFSPVVLQEGYTSGYAHGGGDELSELVNDVLHLEGNGIVETDTDLAELLGVMVRVAQGNELEPEFHYLDPCAGGGRLITGLLSIAFPNIRPTQVFAIEIDKRFSEVLSLRLGLAFARTISPQNAPRVLMAPFETIEPNALANVRVVVMNPPFISGVQSGIKKATFVQRIREISGHDSVLDSGQIAFEIIFLELLLLLVRPGTVIGLIFPYQHLIRLSNELIEFRRYLIDHFGLTHIVFYPREGLFQGVIKQTIILVGKKDVRSDNVTSVEIQAPISNIDFSELLNTLVSNNEDNLQFIDIKSIQSQALYNAANVGWREFIGIGKSAKIFTLQFMVGFNRLSDLPRGLIRRGTVGNSGNTVLTVFDRNMPRFPEITAIIPPDWLIPVQNTSDVIQRIIDCDNAAEMSFIPPEDAYVSQTFAHNTLLRIVNEYLTANNNPQGNRQARAVKTAEKIIADLKNDQKELEADWVVIPRGSRRFAQVSVIEESVLVSSNFVIIKFQDRRERYLFASWMLSIFGQLQLELYSVNQEGMRKLEVGSIKHVVYPRFNDLSNDLAEQLITLFPIEEPLDFSKEITPRLTDNLWAEFLSPEDPESVLRSAVEILQALVVERQSLGEG